jgi:CRISPR-associated protein Csm4
MRGLKLTLRLCGDLGTPLRGDTLFGQLCWALVMRRGEPELEAALAGYTQGRPFLVVADACPKGFLPKPELPAPTAGPDSADLFRRRKAWSKRRWLPADCLAQPLLKAYLAGSLEDPVLPEETMQPHNTINRLTGTTGTGMFAPYQTSRLSVADPRSRDYDLHILLDDSRLPQALFLEMLDDVGKTGYGRDASLGLGKFEVDGVGTWQAATIEVGKAFVALAPSAPPAHSLDARRSYWRTFTRFGRHGGPAFTGAVFKAPLLLADTGAVLTANEASGGRSFIGQGIGGEGRLSKQIPGTVHQGYAPVIPVNLEGWHV